MTLKDKPRDALRGGLSVGLESPISDSGRAESSLSFLLCHFIPAACLKTDKGWSSPINPFSSQKKTRKMNLYSKGVTLFSPRSGAPCNRAGSEKLQSRCLVALSALQILT